MNEVKNVPQETKDVQTRDGAAAIAESLKNCGVEYTFGVTGGGTTYLLKSLLDEGISTIAARTEIGAGWMSYGYNRVKGRLASSTLFHVVGALHASPVMLAAKKDSTPYLSVTINLASALDYREALQDGRELFASLEPLTKYASRVTSAEDVPLAVRQAVSAANTPRFGSSLLDVAYQVLGEETSCPPMSYTPPAAPAADAETIARVLEALKQSKRPCIVAGAGVHLSQAGDEFVELVDALGIPVVSTVWGGRGILPDDHPLYAGPIGSFGWTSANQVVQDSDLWIVLGASLSQMSTAAWTLDLPETIVHVDIEAEQLGKIVEPTIGVWSDAKAFSTGLARLLDEDVTYSAERWEDVVHSAQAEKEKWLDQVQELTDGTEVPISQHHLINVLNELTPDDAIMVTDSGSHAFMTYRGYKYKTASAIKAQGSRYQSLGSGIPIAIGAKLAAPEREVVCVHGDGGLYYDLNELATLSREGIKIILVIDDNGFLVSNRAGARRLLGMDTPWVENPKGTDFVELGKSLGIAGERVEDPSMLSAAYARALESDTTYLIDVITDPDTRLKRSVKDVIPIHSDRHPAQLTSRATATTNHYGFPLDGVWPRRGKQ
ncbi:thiamine pyrophosphate-binding protein [Microbacterium sp. A94]|uniref:thiamine pyrophosphate-binding protein n=1 Tax=Microbacterium sp. A94 TaxID=3450717 RepID=UPI003F435848